MLRDTVEIGDAAVDTAIVIMVILLTAMVLLMFSAPPPATPVRLIGECDGKFYGAMEEDQFPRGCLWIEPILTDQE